MLQSYEEFKTAIVSSLMDKISQRIDTEKENISKELLCVSSEETEEQPSQTQPETK